MKTRTSLIILSVVTLVFIIGLTCELWYISDSRHEATVAFSEAETKLGIDTWSRTMRSIQIEQANELAVLNKATVTRSSFVNVIELIETTAKNLSLAPKISSIKDDPKERTYVRITIETNGSWESTMRFLHLLGNLPYQVVVEDSTLNTSSGQWQNVSDLRFSIIPEKS